MTSFRINILKGCSTCLFINTAEGVLVEGLNALVNITSGYCAGHTPAVLTDVRSGSYFDDNSATSTIYDLKPGSHDPNPKLIL